MSNRRGYYVCDGVGGGRGNSTIGSNRSHNNKNYRSIGRHHVSYRRERQSIQHVRVSRRHVHERSGQRNVEAATTTSSNKRTRHLSAPSPYGPSGGYQLSLSPAATAATPNINDDTAPPLKRTKSNLEILKLKYLILQLETSTDNDKKKADSDDEFAIPETEEGQKQGYNDCLRNMDKNMNNRVSEQAFQVRKNWNKIKRDAVKKTLKKLKGLLRTDYNNGGESTFDSCHGPGVQSNPGLAEWEKTFIKAFQHCIPLDAFFRPHRLESSSICYCPCGSNLQPWRNLHKIVTGRPVSDACSKVFAPNHLMDHLKKYGGMFEEKENGVKVWRPVIDPLHYAARVYLKYLYRHWHGYNFSHKALHPKLSRPYNNAANEEMRLVERAVVMLKRENRKQEEEKAQLQAELGKTAKEKEQFEMMADDHFKKIQELEAVREKLGVDAKKQQTEFSNSEIAKFEKVSSSYFDMMKKVFGVLEDGKVKIKVLSEESSEGGFFLQTFFDTLYEDKKKDGDVRAVLFGDDSSRITKLVLSKWGFIYGKQEKYEFEHERDANAQRESDTAIDEGGPSRQFLTDIFRQISTLSIFIGDMKVKLFEKTSSGVIVVPNAYMIQIAGKYAKDNKHTTNELKKMSEDMLKRAACYCRAIGRIMLHAIVYKHSLSSTSMPPFVMNVMLHGYNTEYHKYDILKHITMLDLPGESTLAWLLTDSDQKDENGNMWTAESFYKKYVPKQYLKSRSILLGSLGDGLTIGGKSYHSDNIEEGCGLTTIFSLMPIEAITRIHFAKPDIGLKDFLNILEPKFENAEGPSDIFGSNEHPTEAQLERLINSQKKFFYDGFQQYIKESAEEDDMFLNKFVECATGSNYLPFDKDFKIHIEFDFSRDPVGYPLFHACMYDVRLPGFESFWDPYDLFKQKMNFSINEVYKDFNMS